MKKPAHDITPRFHMVVTVETTDPISPSVLSYSSVTLDQSEEILEGYRKGSRAIENVTLAEIDHEYKVYTHTGWTDATFDDLNLALTYAARQNVTAKNERYYYVKWEAI